jgi:cold-inducible RNA-binding protein
MKLYVGNLPFKTTEAELTELFAPYGTVVSANVVTDKFSGRSRGFGFVEMGSEEEAQAAIDGVNGKELDGRELRVDRARPPRGPAKEEE